MGDKAGRKLVYGVGYNSGKYPAKENGKHTKSYKLWQHMIRRCYDTDSHYLYRNFAYIECNVSDNFKLFDYFHEWCITQKGFDIPNFHLDKDLLTKNNKLYSEDNCVFIPSEINMMLSNKKGVRGVLPIGVHLHKPLGKYCAQCCFGTGISKNLGLYSTAEEAFDVYKSNKEAYIKTLATKWSSFISEKAYDALMSYSISIYD